MSSQTDGSPPRKRMDYIDVLRGLAVLWVMLRHSMQNYPVPSGYSHLPLQFVVTMANVGWLGVHLFLVLSGFCLYYPLVRSTRTSDVRLKISTFARRRMARILPPYYISIVFVIVITMILNVLHKDPVLAGMPGFPNLLSHLLMVHNLSVQTFGGINSVYWSLALESQLYIIFPILVVVIARRGLPTALLAVFTLSVIWQSIVFLHLGFSRVYDINMAIWYYALPGRCFEFAAGMVTAALVAHPQKIATRWLLILCLPLSTVGFYYANSISLFGPLLDQLWGIAFCCIILMLSQIPHTTFENIRVFRGLVWLGTISYSLYLVHVPMFQFIPLPTRHGDLIGLAGGMARILLAIIVGYGFFLAFERPFLHKNKNANTTNRHLTPLGERNASADGGSPR